MWFPNRTRGDTRDGVRWVFMFRWSGERKRSFDRAYPHRLHLTEKEKLRVAAQEAAAAAKAEQKRCDPPKGTRSLRKRART